MALTTPRMGLRVWNDLDDKYDHEQLADNFAKLDFHNHTPGRGNRIPTDGIEDAAITAAKLAGGVAIGGSSYSWDYVPEESRANAAYGYLTNADRIQNVAVGANTYLYVVYQAIWRTSGSGVASNAGLFFNGTQLRRNAGDDPDGTVVEALVSSNGWARPLYTTVTGLTSDSSSSDSTGPSVTPVVAGGIVAVRLPAGTYEVGVQYKSAGTVSSRDRHLRVFTQDFS